jgi:hypothetical protein
MDCKSTFPILAPRVEHWKIAINVLRYLKFTINWGIALGQGSGTGGVMIKQTPPEPDVVAFSDANHGTGIDDKKSTTGYVLQVYGGPVSWGSKVQNVTALSTTESEFRALSTASREALWLAKIVKLFGIPSMPFLIKGDNKGSMMRSHLVKKVSRSRAAEWKREEKSRGAPLKSRS